MSASSQETPTRDDQPSQIPQDVVSAPKSGRHSFVIGDGICNVIEGSDGRLYERDGDVITLVTRVIQEDGNPC